VVTIRSWFRRRRAPGRAAVPAPDPQPAIEPEPEPAREPDVEPTAAAAATDVDLETQPRPSPEVDEAFVAAIAAWTAAQQVPGLPAGASPTFGDRAMVLQRARTLVAGIATGQVPKARGRQALGRLRKPIDADRLLGPASSTRDTPAGEAVARAQALDRAAWAAVDDTFA
jgi:hypothetical protein